MTIHVALHHRTTYRYARPVALGPQTVRLRPAPHCRTRVGSYALAVTPETHFLNWQQDPQSNWLARLVFPEKTDVLEIVVDLVAEIEPYNPFDFFLEPYVEEWPFAYEEALQAELAPYRVTVSSPLLDAFVAKVPRETKRTSDFLVALNQELASHIAYRVRLEPGLQTPDETLAKASGSCRDSGWLLCHVLRQLGFATRFVSGYLVQLTADVAPLEGPKGPAADFVDLHAWCEVYLPGAGWIGLDPTSGLLAGEGHLPLACSAEPQAAAPVSGLVEPCEAVLDHEMRVTRIHETPRVTKPYEEDTWNDIVALGRAVDRDLAENDVRLTMGGEPTFVAVDDLDAAEWNIEAVGPTKKARAIELFKRLRARHAPKGLVHFGQGKWYPGEQLPRWALSLFWRRDGVPLWERDDLVSDEQPRGVTEAVAHRVLRGVATHLGLGPDHVIPAYEDWLHYLWREQKLPVNVDPLDAKLGDPLERERLRRVFGRGIGAVVGWVLPVGRRGDTLRSGRWPFRGEQCLLLPGDSPMGLRLPLASHPYEPEDERETFVELDPSAERPPLPSRAELAAAHGAAPRALPEKTPFLRTAMCAEARNGVLHVFLPPTETASDFVTLVFAVERAAADENVPVVLEGYAPPRDPRLGSLSITPDPGVVEVNIHPSASWDELVDNTTHLYEAAHATRLTAEKFLVDGRHVGTGGGNHVVLGGASPDDSPFLRRPDLLRSLLAYHHQHPSLSYLFSGLFIGPTSQAPRLDEARNDSIYELEIACREVERLGRKDAPPPWLVDRLFRDLLTDVTGNTHRTEICIDKLWSPDSASGRLGLVELRSLEMPPHARMSLAEQLLLRAMVARFWKKPFAPARLTRWGTELHDRFMLPHFVWQDFEDVLDDMAHAGYPLEPSWFLPHFEFRFPKAGDFETRGIRLELRTALEPWHVTGEDGTPGGTARFVDASLERLQIEVTGMPSDRYLVTCNGVSAPLRGTGRVGHHVAGVRYRAWKPPRSLHPHLDVDAPLVFDLHDTWTGQSLGGCTYHVTHPGGRSWDERPVNALEAAGRRRARFQRIGRGDGRTPLTPTPSLEYPFTLDLRTAAKR